MTAAERAALRSALWMLVGAAAAVPVLVLPAPDDPMLTVVLHLSVITLFALALAVHLAGLLDEGWFTGSGLSDRARAAAAGAWIVVLTTGATGLATLATSAAFRYEPSLQFLQLLSALDIAWVVATFTIGLRWWFDASAGVAGGFAMGTVCVWSIWTYLNAVGFTPEGGWLVDGGEIARLVLPFDLMAAVMAIAAFSIGVRRAHSQPTEQPSSQS
ncbi:MAG TPA: hypothetical protein VLD62_03290 [Acidimicrobiia bacterium]|nr:hypothetical protein [Acidimicrobiia bacterium]